MERLYAACGFEAEAAELERAREIRCRFKLRRDDAQSLSYVPDMLREAAQHLRHSTSCRSRDQTWVRGEAFAGVCDCGAAQSRLRLLRLAALEVWAP